MEPVLQTELPHAPWRDAALGRLPGMRPLDLADWLVIDEAFAGQMALRDRLLAERRADVTALRPEAEAAAAELLDLVVDQVARRSGYEPQAGAIRRPDGVRVPLDRDDPLATAGRLVQEDLCILQSAGGEHRLTAAVLCFPASWTLAEKLGRPLGRIHAPVAPYDAAMARRVERLFAGALRGQAMWRANLLLYETPELFAPRREAEPRRPGAAPRYVRSERQSLVALPRSGAVVFSIHTYLLSLASMAPADRAAIDAFVGG